MDKIIGKKRMINGMSLRVYQRGIESIHLTFAGRKAWAQGGQEQPSRKDSMDNVFIMNMWLAR